MTFRIDTQIPQDWTDSFQEFEKKYADCLSNLHSSLANKTIEVKPLVEGDFWVDENNPIQANEDTESIEYSTNNINLMPSQREALIAHEIGHIIHKGSFKNDKQRLEIECDKVTKSLGIGAALKEALIILRDKYISQPEAPLRDMFYKEKVKQDIAELDQRINLL